MTDPIRHLSGIEASWQQTNRMQMHVLTSGPLDGEPVLFLHGNLSSATFWEETMLSLPDAYRGVAVDLRGYGASPRSSTVDATRGVADWVDDVVALAEGLHWDRFHLIAHSLGGCVAWALIALHAERIRTATLVAPGPPCGFGGARGERGELNHADGAGSGAGLVHPELVRRISAGEREIVDELFSPRAVMNRLYWKPPFCPSREESLLTAMLQVHLGEGRFPGDTCESLHWPGFSPGSHGPINAISPRYNQWVLPSLINAGHKPPLLWIHGADDPIVCDASLSDVAVQGKLGFRDGWPGDDVFPPQPLRSQVAYACDQYTRTGGSTKQLCLPDVGHTPYLEQPARFGQALFNHLKS